MELDHVFLCVDDAPSAERTLADFGIQLSRRGTHPGQGTANACAFFDNAYLELLYLHAEDELRSEAVRPLGLWERLHWRTTGACPFGVAFRPEPGDDPVETWPYAAAYLPPGASIPIVTLRGAFDEPLVFLSTVSQPPAMWPAERRPPLEHRGARRRLGRVAVSGPRPAILSPGLKMLCDLGVLAVEGAAEHHLALTWEQSGAGLVQEFAPSLPLSLRW
jgi:hypothetical protein